MIAFEIYVNETRLCCAGAGQYGVLSAAITWVRSRRVRAPLGAKNVSQFDPPFLLIGGLRSTRGNPDQYFNRERKELSIGDTIRLRIVNTNFVDDPPEGRGKTPESPEEKNEALYKAYKQEFDGNTELVENAVPDEDLTCFRVTINGATTCTAGIGKFGVLLATLTWVRKEAETNETSDLGKLDFRVGGLTSPSPGEQKEHVCWTKERLSIGDELIIQIIHCKVPDEPRSREVDDPDAEERNRMTRKKWYERMKSVFEGGTDILNPYSLLQLNQRLSRTFSWHVFLWPTLWKQIRCADA